MGKHVVGKPRGLAPGRRQRRMQPDFLLVAQHFNPRKAVGIRPHRIEDAREVCLNTPAPFLQKMRQQKRHLVSAERPLLRIEQFVPALLRRRNLESLRNKLVPRIQIVSTLGSDRTGQHVQQHQRSRRLPSTQIARRAAPPQMRRKPAARRRDLTRGLDDHIRFDAAFLLRKLRRKSCVVFLQSVDERFETLPLARKPSTSSSSQFVQFFTNLASKRFSSRITFAIASSTAASVPG